MMFKGAAVITAVISFLPLRYFSLYLFKPVPFLLRSNQTLYYPALKNADQRYRNFFG